MPQFVVPPSAVRVEIFECDEPNCVHVHALLIDEDGDPVDQMTVGPDIVKLFQAALYKKAAST